MRSKLTILAMMFIALVSCNTGSETSVSFHVEDTQLYPEAVLMTKDSIYKQALTSNNSTTFTLPETSLRCYVFRTKTCFIVH